MATVHHVAVPGTMKLDGNDTRHWWWNHIDKGIPETAVWHVNAVPFPTANAQGGFAGTMEFEVVRYWRKMILIEKKPFPQSQTFDLEVEHEFHYEVKNLRNTSAEFRIVLTAIW